MNETPDYVPAMTSAPQDGALLMIIRFFGGMVLAVSLPLLVVGVALVLDVPYGYGLNVPEFLIVVTILISILAGGVYTALHLQEARTAQRTQSVPMWFILRSLSVVLRFCGGLFLANLACMPFNMLLQNSVLVDAGMIVMTAFCLVAGVLAVWLPLGRKRWF